MKTIFDTDTRNDLLKRIDGLRASQKPEWGKMSAYQMVKHCRLSEEMFQGRKTYKRLFIGRLFGAMALQAILKDEKPMKKNQPTHADMKITDTGNFDEERNQWAARLQDYSTLPNTDFIHPFFGKMTRPQIGEYVYKHTDHHLRQFCV